MGYMGLSSWVESDHAADFRYTLQREFGTTEGKPVRVRNAAIKRLIREEMENQGNSYNTEGAINIALVMEDEGSKAADYEEIGTPVFSKLLTKTEFRMILDRLKELLKEADGYIKKYRYDGTDNVDYHKKEYQRLFDSVLRKSYKE